MPVASPIFILSHEQNFNFFFLRAAMANYTSQNLLQLAKWLSSSLKEISESCLGGSPGKAFSKGAESTGVHAQPQEGRPLFSFGMLIQELRLQK